MAYSPIEEGTMADQALGGIVPDSIAAIAAAQTAGTLTAVTLVEHYLDRIARVR